MEFPLENKKKVVQSKTGEGQFRVIAWGWFLSGCLGFRV
jgi:hypothetical protein